MGEYDKYLKKVAISSLFNSGVSALATALLLPRVIKNVGMDVYGIWAILTIFVGIASALDFGIWKSLVYWIPRQTYSRDQLVSSAIILCTLGALAFAVVLAAVLLAGVPLFGSLITGQGNVRWWLGAGGCVILFSSLITNLARGVLEASYRGDWVNIGNGLLTFLQYGIAACVSRWTHDPRALILGSTLVYILILAAHMMSVNPRSFHLERPKSGAVTGLLKYGGGSFVADAPSILLGPVMLYLFVLTAASSAEYGVLDIALRIATLAGTALALLSTPFFALFAAANAATRHKVRTIMSRHLRYTMVLGLVGWLTFLLIGKQIVAALFVERSAEIYRASLIILVGTVAVAAMEPVTRMLMGLGRLRTLASIRFLMLATALLSLELVANLPPLERFAISCAVGFVVSAIGLCLSNNAEHWGYAKA